MVWPGQNGTPIFILTVIIVLSYAVGLGQCRKDVMFGLGSKYGEGTHPSVALIGEDAVIEVHRRSDKILAYHLGKVEGLSVAWGQEFSLGFGQTPDVAANKAGQVILVYNLEHDRETKKRGNPFDQDILFYRTGIYNKSTHSMLWASERKYDNGVEPTVSLGDDGTVVEVHRNGSKLLSRIGRLGPRTVEFQPADVVDKGNCPDVSLNSNGDVVMVYGYGMLSNAVNYSTAKLVPGSSQVTWTSTTQLAKKAADPSVAINDDGFVAIIHRSAGTLSFSDAMASDVISRTGNLDQSQRSIQFGEGSVAFDGGAQASISANRRIAIQVHASKHLSTLWYSVSFIVDRSRWMEHNPQLQERRLVDITLPATHDSGAYDLLNDRAPGCSGASGVPGKMLEMVSGKLTRVLAQAQDHNILQQLEGGIRFMDIRPYYRNGTFHAFHDNINNDTMDMMLSQIKKFMMSTEKELVLLTITHFCKVNFNPDVHRKLMNQIKEQIGPYLYKGDADQNLVQTRMKDFVGQGSRVLLMYADSIANELGSKEGFWPMLNISGKYSNTEDVEDMKKKQLQKLNEGQMHGEQLIRLYFTLTFNPLKMTKFYDIGKSLHDITKPASRNLAQFVAQLDRSIRVNLLYVDYYEESRNTDIAIWLNSRQQEHN